MTPLQIIQSRAQAQAFLQQADRQGHEVFLTTRQCAERFGWDTSEAFRVWAKRSQLTPLYVGRILRFSSLDVRAEMERQTRERLRGRV